MRQKNTLRPRADPDRSPEFVIPDKLQSSAFQPIREGRRVGGLEVGRSCNCHLVLLIDFRRLQTKGMETSGPSPSSDDDGMTGVAEMKAGTVAVVVSESRPTTGRMDGRKRKAFSSSKKFHVFGNEGSSDIETE